MPTIVEPCEICGKKIQRQKLDAIFPFCLKCTHRIRWRLEQEKNIAIRSDPQLMEMLRRQTMEELESGSSEMEES